MLLDLFIGFLKVGLFSFGGAYSAIPIIRDVVSSRGWLTDEMLSYMIAVSESTPGPLMINLATYIGSRKAGIPGAIIATFAVALPAFVIILLVLAAFRFLLKSRYVQAVLDGFKSCIMGVILATGITMIAESVAVQQEAGAAAEAGSLPRLSVFGVPLEARALAIACLVAAVLFGGRLILKKKVSPILLILISAALGIVFYGV